MTPLQENLRILGIHEGREIYGTPGTFENLEMRESLANFARQTTRAKTGLRGTSPGLIVVQTAWLGIPHATRSEIGLRERSRLQGGMITDPLNETTDFLERES